MQSSFQNQLWQVQDGRTEWACLLAFVEDGDDGHWRVEVQRDGRPFMATRERHHATAMQWAADLKQVVDHLQAIVHGQRAA